MKEVGTDIFGQAIIENELLRDKFMEPPFTILDAKGGAWQARKRLWKALGMESEKGREGVECMSTNFDEVDEVTGLSKYGRKAMTGTSIFDPALCELLLTWFCPKGGRVLDPFAGGSVRGIVSNYLGYPYSGIDIRQIQVDSNREQALSILPVNNQPQWYVGDSDAVLSDTWPTPFNFILTCPPYHDLEVYSDDPNDLSNMDYDSFLIKYDSIIRKSVALLEENSFAVFVVGDIRDKDGFLRNFVSHTKQIFIAAGCKLYNEGHLLQPLGTAMLRANRVFGSNKKLVKVHEDVLVFYKGDPKLIRQKFENK